MVAGPGGGRRSYCLAGVRPVFKHGKLWRWMVVMGVQHYGCVLPFHTAHGVLKARILKWFAIPFCSGPHFVRTLHQDP